MKIILEFDTDNEGAEEEAAITMQAAGMRSTLIETFGKLRETWKYSDEQVKVDLAQEIRAFIVDELVDNEVTCVEK